MRSIKDRLLAKSIPEPNTGCLLWFGATNPAGYGKIKAGSRFIDVHRISYQEFVGPLGYNDSVLHRCDVRCCVEPSHLFLGSQSDNMADMVAKGRSNRGERHWRARISSRDVRDIKALCSGGMKQRVVGGLYDISQGHVSGICNGAYWK